MQKACKLFLFLKDSHAFITSSVKFTASRSTQQFVYSAVPHPTENNQSVHTLCTGTVFKSNNHTAVFFNGLHNFHRSSAHWTSCDQNTMFPSFLPAAYSSFTFAVSASISAGTLEQSNLNFFSRYSLKRIISLFQYCNADSVCLCGSSRINISLKPRMPIHIFRLIL